MLLRDDDEYNPCSDPEIRKPKVNGKLMYQVWMDHHLIEEYKTLPPAKKLLKQMIEDNYWS